VSILYIEKIKLPSIAIGSPEEIVFTQQGLLAGRILVEIEDEHAGWKYIVLIRIVWLSLIVLFITTIVVPFLKVFWLFKYY
jgi:hypothetical protein